MTGDPRLDRGEATFVVRESKRRQGIGALLLSTMQAVARKRGIGQVWGRVRMENLPMIALFKRFGGTVKPDDENPSTEVTIGIPVRQTNGDRKGG